MAESAAKTAKNLLRKAMKSKSDAYLSILDYRNTPSQNTCNSPAQKLLGRRTKTLLPYKKDLLEPNSLPTENITNKRRQSQDKQAYYYNKNAKDLPELRPGDTVRMNPFRLNQREWDKAKVTKRLDTRSYEVQTDTGMTYRRNRQHLRKTNEKPPSVKHNTVPSTDQTEEAQTQPETPTKQNDLLPVTESGNNNPPIVTRAGRKSRPPDHLKDYIRN